MKNYPEQIKMLRDLRDSKSISESEFQAMLEILLQEVDGQNEKLNTKTKNSGIKRTKQKKQEEHVLFEPIINSDSEITSLKQKTSTLILGVQLYNLLYGGLLIVLFLFWQQFVSAEGFWEQFIFFCLLSFFLGTHYESKFSAWIYGNFSALLNLSLYSQKNLSEELNVENPVYQYVSNSRNVNAQYVLNKIIQYFFLYRFGIFITYTILVKTLINPITLLGKILFFEGLSRSGNFFYYEILILTCIKLYLVFKSLNSGVKLKKELYESFAKLNSKKISELNPQLQFFFVNAQNLYFGPFSSSQIKIFMGLKLISNETPIKNGYGTQVEITQFLR
jgi:hypothetical protein